MTGVTEMSLKKHVLPSLGGICHAIGKNEVVGKNWQ